MDFTREPIIESVVTPKEGCKLVIRSSKGVGQEEFFVDAVEIVSFGNTFFLRSFEKPKAFLVPVTDYEILEVRETRMVLKNVGLDRSIKIGGGKETQKRSAKETAKPEVKEAPQEVKAAEPKRRERRRHYRKRRGKELEAIKDISDEDTSGLSEGERVQIPAPEAVVSLEEEGIGKPIKPTPSILSSLLPPPPTLISESIERYKGDELFKNVFIPKEERKKESDSVSFTEFEDEPTVELEVPPGEENFFDFDLDLEDSTFDVTDEESSESQEAQQEPLPSSEEELSTGEECHCEETVESQQEEESSDEAEETVESQQEEESGDEAEETAGYSEEQKKEVEP